MRKITKKCNPTVTIYVIVWNLCVLLPLFDGPMCSRYVELHMEQAIKPLPLSHI